MPRTMSSTSVFGRKSDFSDTNNLMQSFRKMKTHTRFDEPGPGASWVAARASVGCSIPTVYAGLARGCACVGMHTVTAYLVWRGKASAQCCGRPEC